MGLTGAAQSYAAWTSEEDDLVRALFPSATWPEMLAEISARTRAAIMHHALRLGVKRQKRYFGSETLTKFATLARERKPRLGKVLYPVIARDGVSGKFCRLCQEWKPLKKFARHVECSGGVRNICTTCGGRNAREKYPDVVTRSVRKWQAKNPERVAEIKRASRRHRHGLEMLGPGISVHEYRELIALFGGQCAYCREALADTLDHVLPMSRGGRHEASNLLPACRSCNFQKRNKTLEEWHASLMRKEN